MKWNQEINLDEHNVWFTADLHLYHDNILWMNKRPFKNCDEMWEFFKADWISKVKQEDYVFILGDVLWGSQASRLANMANSLPGHICIVMGNHDKEKTGVNGKGSNFDVFESCDRMDFIRVKSQKFGIDQLIFMSHYPTISWPQKSRGSIMLHGHVHGSMDELNEKSSDLRVDVGVDGKLAQMKLLSFNDIYEYMLHKTGDISLQQYMQNVYNATEKTPINAWIDLYFEKGKTIL
jgi:calcineurin-like phosphoesterase family protein